MIEAERSIVIRRGLGSNVFSLGERDFDSRFANKKDPAFRKRKTGSFAIPLKGAGNRANPAAAFRQTPHATAGRASIEKLYGN